MTPKLKEQLEAAREALSAALSASTAGNTQLAKVERDRTTIAAQLKQLEAQTEGDPDDESAVGRLSTLREQQRLFDKKLVKLRDNQLRDERPRRALEEAQQAAGDLLKKAAQPELDKVLSEAQAAFTPFFRDPSRLRLAVEGNDKVLSCKAFLANGGTGPMNEKPKRLLSLLDGLIAGGGCGWTWQPVTATTDSK